MIAFFVGLDFETFDGDLPVRHSRRRMAGLAVSRRAGPASDLSDLLRLAGRDGVEAVVGRRVRLSRLSVGGLSSFGRIASKIREVAGRTSLSISSSKGVI